MELGAILLLLAVLIIVFIFVAQPFTQHWHAQGQNRQEISVLLANRENALNSLQELDFDFKLGKIPAEEYTTQRASLVQTGADILRRLDEMQGSQPVPPQGSVTPAVMEQASQPLADEDLEDLIAKRRAARQQKTAGFCPKCGKPILQSDQFCPSCGQALNPQQSQPQ